MDCTIDQARRDFERGLFTGAQIHEVMVGRWCVVFAGKNAMFHGKLLTARGNVREFSTLDSAVNTLRGIGFRAVGLDVKA